MLECHTHSSVQRQCNVHSPFDCVRVSHVRMDVENYLVGSDQVGRPLCRPSAQLLALWNVPSLSGNLEWEYRTRPHAQSIFPLSLLVHDSWMHYWTSSLGYSRREITAGRTMRCTRTSLYLRGMMAGNCFIPSTRPDHGFSFSTARTGH